MTPILKNLFHIYTNFADTLSEPDYRYHIDDPQNKCIRNFTFDEFVSLFISDIDFRKFILNLE